MNVFSTNTHEVPRDLSSVMDQALEQPASSGGMTEQQINKIWQSTKALYRSGNHPLVALCLRRKGQILINRTLGHRQLATATSAAQIASTTTPICLFSASKMVTAMLVHMLDEAGALNLLDPISRYIPQYAQNGKRYATIFHLLSHRGGIPRPRNPLPPEILFDKDAILAELYAAKPVSAAGSTLAYHAVTAGYILGEIIERVTQQSLHDVIKTRLSDPMGMRCFDYGLAPQFRAEVAYNYSSGLYAKLGTDQYLSRVLGADLDTAVRITNDSRFMDTISPAANIYTSAEEIGRFFEMLLNGGRFQDKHIMSPETIFRATLPTSGIKIDHSLFVPMRYALGPMLGNNPVGLFGPYTGQAFGHLGFSNIFCWADPARDISVALLTTGKSVVGTHLPSLAHLLYQISMQCPRVKISERRFMLRSGEAHQAHIFA